MSQLAQTNPWILALIALLLGALAGVLLTLAVERRKSGGRTVEDVQRELDDYKEEVGKHFATTSELFRDMTEKYRDVYNHLAAGSQQLCEDSMDHPLLEFTEARAVSAGPESNDEQPAAKSRTEDQTAAEAETPVTDKPEAHKPGAHKSGTKNPEAKTPEKKPAEETVGA